MQGDQVLEYRVYGMRPPRLVGGQLFAAGRLSETIRPGSGEPGASPLLAVLAGMNADHAALIDELFNLLFDEFIPLSPSVFKMVPVRVLTDATETAALVIPLTAAGGQTHLPLPAGRYRLDFRIDRARFRSEIPDDASNYHAEASVVLDW